MSYEITGYSTGPLPSAIFYGGIGEPSYFAQYNPESGQVSVREQVFWHRPLHSREFKSDVVLVGTGCMSGNIADFLSALGTQRNVVRALDTLKAMPEKARTLDTLANYLSLCLNAARRAEPAKTF